MNFQVSVFLMNFVDWDNYFVLILRIQRSKIYVGLNDVLEKSVKTVDQKNRIARQPDPAQ